MSSGGWLRLNRRGNKPPNKYRRTNRLPLLYHRWIVAKSLRGGDQIVKTRKFDGNDHKQVMIGMITNSTFLGRIAAKWNCELFASDAEKWIASSV